MTYIRNLYAEQHKGATVAGPYHRREAEMRVLQYL